MGNFGAAMGLVSHYARDFPRSSEIAMCRVRSEGVKWVSGDAELWVPDLTLAYNKNFNGIISFGSFLYSSRLHM